MRLVLANPHYWIYGKTVANVLLRRKNFMRYNYFIEEYLNDKNRDTAIYVDGTKTSFAAVKIRFVIFPKFFAFLELIIWMLINKINPLKNKIYFNINKLNKDNDIFVDFARSFNLKDKEKPGVGKFEGISLIFFTHYFLMAKEISNLIKNIPNFIVASENNLTNNTYFKKYFHFIKKVYHLPFAYDYRFISNKNFRDRINRCLAIGNMCAVNNKEFIDFFKSNIVHPMRKNVCDNSQKYPDAIESLIEPLDDIRNVEVNNSFAGKIIRKLIPRSIFTGIFGHKNRKKYYKFNILEKYNEYRMFICPEEIVGLPSVTAIEGMACGSAYIGIDDSMYTNIGLVPGVHYITYKENDINDLISKIRYYQNNPELLQKIAEEGCRFVRENFNRKSVSETLWNDLETIHRKFIIDKKIDLVCSFEK